MCIYSVCFVFKHCTKCDLSWQLRLVSFPYILPLKKCLSLLTLALIIDVLPVTLFHVRLKNLCLLRLPLAAAFLTASMVPSESLFVADAMSCIIQCQMPETQERASLKPSLKETCPRQLPSRGEETSDLGKRLKCSFRGSRETVRVQYRQKKDLAHNKGTGDKTFSMIRGLQRVHGFSQVAQSVKNLSAMQESWVRSLGWEDSLGREMVAHSSILAGKSHGQRSLMGYSPQGHQSWTQLSV